MLDLQSAFDKGELPADLKPVVDKADFNFFYRRQQHEHALMNSRLCEKLDAAMAPGDWPSFTQSPDASGNPVPDAYRMLRPRQKSSRSLCLTYSCGRPRVGALRGNCAGYR